MVRGPRTPNSAYRLMYTESTRPRDVSIFRCPIDMTHPAHRSGPHSQKGDIVFCTDRRDATWGFATAHPVKDDIGV